MIIKLLQFNWIGLILIVLTFCFVIQDRAFSKKVRTEFQVVSILVFYNTLLGEHLIYGKAGQVANLQNIALINDILLKIIIFGILLSLYFQLKNNIVDTVFAIATCSVMIISTLIEYIYNVANYANGIMCLIVAVYYYYFVMQNYKKDGLTKLLLRRDLYYEMEDLHDKAYDVVLVDVDKFKLINDKYGHDKGDEVLITIASTIKKYVPKKCRVYRYGGDEFIIISRVSDSSIIENAFEDINNELLQNDLRISYGISRHNPGEWGKDSVTEADERMYENKKLLKSEDIWDDMTGLYNFRGFLDELEVFRTNVSKDDNKICLVSMDIDRLNNINMAYGYAEGNLAILALARVIKTCLKGREFIGHLGSDEFAVAIECENEEDERVISFIDDINEGLSSAYEFASKDYSLKINIGRYLVPDDNKISVEELVNNVLYAKQADKEDRRKTGLAEDDSEYDDQEEAIVMDILDNNKIKYAFQPIVSAKDGEIVAYEALMRSNTDTMISPLKILKYAERNKRLYDVEKYSFFNVLGNISDNNIIAEGRRIFINSIPGVMLKDIDYNLLTNKFSDLFENVVVEITEQRELEDEALSLINSRRANQGFNLAIDDYGSGYSNTNSLLRYMPQVVKLDRLLITGIDRNAKKQFFVNSIISFARENDMLILAEGVETENELKTVIRLGVDMIQGFFTAKPSFDVLDAIPADIKKIIVDENIKVGGNQRMVYTAASDCDLSVVHLAMEDYTKINISAEKVGLLGNKEYTSDMVIRIKENVKSTIWLKDVNLNSVDDEPCIDIGENSDLTIQLEGDNCLNSKGIHVPESSSLTIKGTGNLTISAKGHECYAIGSDSESAFGNIFVRNSGNLHIIVDGERCVGIGGGVVGANSEIAIAMGARKINVAGIEAAVIGCYKGSVPISIKDCSVDADIRVNKGVFIGTFDGELNTTISNFDIKIEGSGTEVCGIGSINKSSGTVNFDSGSYKIKLNGQKLFLLGCKEGELDINFSHTKIDMIGEGDNVLGFGSYDKKSNLHTPECSLSLVINASSPLGFGLASDDFGIKGNQVDVRINGTQEIY